MLSIAKKLLKLIKRRKQNIFIDFMFFIFVVTRFEMNYVTVLIGWRVGDMIY